MILCMCTGVDDDCVRKEIDRGAKDFKAIKNQLGVARTCGRCSNGACERFAVLLKEATAADGIVSGGFPSPLASKQARTQLQKGAT